MITANRSALTAAVYGSALLALTPGAEAADARAVHPMESVVTVHYADLNPSTPVGVAALYARIEDAARSVCGPSFSLWDPGAYRNWRLCYRMTVDHTVRQLDLPLLTALHQTPGSPLHAQPR
jgi:UrcA family protein